MKAAYRFFGNNKSSFSKIQEAHFRSTISRMSEHKVVLIPQDTTLLNFTSQKSRKDTGPTVRESANGIFLHSAIALTPQGLCLGHISSKQWYRDKLQRLSNSQKSQKNYSTPIESKESYRWLENYCKANEYAKMLSNTMVVSIADREGDIYDIYKEAQRVFSEQPMGKRAHYLIRAQYDRKVCNKEGEKLNDKIKSLLISEGKMGEMEIDVSRTSKRESRKARLSVFCKRIFIDVPDKYKKEDRELTVELTAILCREDSSSIGEEKIEWLLLTDLEIKTFDDVCEKVKWYSLRWQIEIFFKILKSGCNIEKLQLQDSNFSTCLSFYIIVAWRILFITAIGRHHPDLSCESVFSKQEWQMTHIMIKRKKPNKSPPKLKEMIRMVASLGGYVNVKSSPEPGVKTIWIGLRIMQEHIKAQEAIKHVYGRCG